MSLDKVLSNDKRFEDYAAKNTAGYADTEKALEVVKKFIIDHDLIIYGGMAIDLALKAKGHKGIYKDDSVPDYDFMSPKHYEHACELADLLANKEFGDVQAVNAVHVSTYKVRTNFVWVADITYIPMEVFKTIPTLKVGGLRIVHPDFQRLDMHRAMSTPLEKPPMEVFLHRARKDQKRFRMLDELYPLANVSISKAVNLEWQVRLDWYKGNTIGGTQAYCILYTVLKELVSGSSKLAKSAAVAVKSDPQILKRFESLPSASFTYENNKMKFAVSSDKSLDSLNIISDDFENTLNVIGSSKKTYFNKYVDDWRPRTIVLTDLSDASLKEKTIEVFDNKPRLLPIYNLATIGKMLDATWPEGVEMCLPQYVLMYYLQKYFGGGFTNQGKLDKKNNTVYLQMYNATKTIIEIAEIIYKSLKDVSEKKGGNEKQTEEVSGPDPIDAVFAHLPFFLTDKIYGSFNWSPDYIISVREQNYFINYVPIAEQEIMKPPRGYYLKEPPAKFDPSQSPFFQFDGLECEPFKSIELFPVFEKPAPSKPGMKIPSKKKYLSWQDVDIYGSADETNSRKVPTSRLDMWF